MKNTSTRQSVVLGGLLLLLGGLLLVQEFVELSEWVWIIALIGSGLAVYGIYAIAREETWMLIMSYVLLAIGVLILIATQDLLDGTLIATYVFVVIAIPFVYGYFRTGRENWGLLIPAYVMLVLAVFVPLVESETLQETTIPAFILFAVSLPFFAAFAANSSQRWALVVGGITALVGISLLFASGVAEYVLPIALILAGVWILVRQITRREPSSADTASE